MTKECVYGHENDDEFHYCQKELFTGEKCGQPLSLVKFDKGRF